MNTPRPCDTSDSQINRLVDAHELEQRALAAMGPLQALYDWIHFIVTTPRPLDPIRFVPREPCKCPIAVYLRERLGRREYMPSVGDDEVSIYPFWDVDAERLAVVALPAAWRAFAYAFDEFAGRREYLTARDVEWLLTQHAAEWRIRV